MSLDEQYRDDTNLRARIDIHARFSTNPEGWHRWLFDRVAPRPGARILEVGCGPGELWRENADRIDPSWSLTLADRSPGMVEAARAVLGDRAALAVADVEELPFADESFDVVLASHMLYHVADRPRALRELRRVLAVGGVLHAATNGAGHMRELAELVGDDYARGFAGHIRDFGLETGREQLAAVFGEVDCRRYEDSLVVTEVEPLVAYVRSSLRFAGSEQGLRTRVAAALGADGALRIGKQSGVLTARKA